MQRRPVHADSNAVAAMSMAAIKTSDTRLPDKAVSGFAAEVIARLSRRMQKPDRTPPGEINRIADALIAGDDEVIAEIIEAQLARDDRLASLYLGLLAEAARELGRRWDKDLVHSVDVTIGSGRIFGIMRAMAARIMPTDLSGRRHVVLASVPGEQHSLGVAMAADLLREDGWLVELKSGRKMPELLRDLSQTEFSLLGLSATSSGHVTGLGLLIDEVRVMAPRAKILVAGRLAALDPALCRRLGADAVAPDFETARLRLETLNEEMALAEREPPVWA